MEQYIWLFNRKDNKGLAWSFTASLLFHALMFAILATTPIFHPLTGDAERLDIIWLYPLLGKTTESTADSPPLQVVQKSPPKALVTQEKKTFKPEQERVPKAKPAPLTPPLQERLVKVTPPQPVSEAEDEAETEMKLPAAPEPVQTAKVEAEQAERPVESGVSEIKEVESAPAELAPAAEAPPKAPVAEIEEGVAEKTPELPGETASPPVQVAQPPYLPPAPGPTTQGGEMGTPSLPAPLPSEKGEGGGLAIEQKATEPPSVAKTASEEQPPQKPSEAKGIFAPPAIGDLKLEITGKGESLPGLRVTVAFRELPRARRNAPTRRMAERPPQSVAPKLAKPRENTLQAVVEIAGEGVYYFAVEPESGKPVEASFLVRLFESSSKARTSQIGARTVEGKTPVAKVLMPEGILWDEEAAFTGSVEDSESVTKFNTDTDLVWKEYKE